jgi:CRP/FNR family transcriptional regulator, cyclic AMP receptor protein
MRLLDVEPDLGQALGPGHQESAMRLTVPVLMLLPGRVEPDELGFGDDCFGAVIHDGLILHRLVLGDRVTARLLGPGDIIVPADPLSRTLQQSYDATRECTVALLDDRVATAARLLPELLPLLQRRMAAQHQRLVVQMGICQLPRVSDSILALLWMLAESWGRVGREGTILPMQLTHTTIGELVGAKRPTVTLALSELAREQAIVREPRGWLLLSPPPQAVASLLSAPAPRLAGPAPAADAPLRAPQATTPAADPYSAGPALQETVASLQLAHRAAIGRFELSVAGARAARRRNRELRGRARPAPVSSPPAPSSG